MAVPTAFYVLGWAFPIYANVWNREVLDGHRETDLNVSDAHTVARGDGGGGQLGEKGVQTERVEVSEVD
jgi:FHS family L-fucose permease-like MFS transporter